MNQIIIRTNHHRRNRKEGPKPNTLHRQSHKESDKPTKSNVHQKDIIYQAIKYRFKIKNLKHKNEMLRIKTIEKR